MNIPHIFTALGWNKRQLTYADFEWACTYLGITIIHPNIKTMGMFFVCEGTPIIALSNRLQGVRLWLVAWHELVHYLLHPLGLRCFSRGTLNKAEYEANVIAICAVIDEDTLFRILTYGELHDFPKDFVDKRMEVTARHHF